MDVQTFRKKFSGLGLINSIWVELAKVSYTLFSAGLLFQLLSHLSRVFFTYAVLMKILQKNMAK